jgi:hypothetical protein
MTQRYRPAGSSSAFTPSPGASFGRQLWQFHHYERNLYHLVCRWLYRASVDGKPFEGGDPAELAPWPWHAANLFVHWLATMLAYWVFSTWLPPERALLVAAVFALHPIQTTSVCYISGLSGMMALLFTLAGIRHIQLGGWEHWALAALSQYFACKSKQEGFLYLALYPIFFSFLGERPAPRARAVGSLAPADPDYAKITRFSRTRYR